jgi:hypothetical protein
MSMTLRRKVEVARTQYETNEDLIRESEVAQAIADRKGDEWAKVPAHYAHFCDVVFIRKGEIVCYCEVRCRNMKWGQYPDILMSVHKWNSGVSLVASTRKPWLFAVSVEEGIFGFLLKPDEDVPSLRQSFAGRTKQQRDNADIEPVIHLPISSFNMLVRRESL